MSAVTIGVVRDNLFYTITIPQVQEFFFEIRRHTHTAQKQVVVAAIY